MRSTGVPTSRTIAVYQSYYIGALNAKLSEKPRYILFPIGMLY